MKSLSWMMQIALAPLGQKPARFFIYIAIFFFLGTAIFLFQNFNTSLQNAQQQNASQILGGDVEVNVGFRPFDDVESEYLDTYSTAQSEIINTRTMLEMDYGSIPQIRLSNLRAVDDAYPLLGEIEFANDVENKDLHALLAPQDDKYGVLFSKELTEYFGAKPGDFVRILGQNFVFNGTIMTTPDVEGSFNFLLPSAVISKEGFESLGVTNDKMLLAHRRFLLLDPTDTPADFRTRASVDFHDKGWQITTNQGFAQGQSANFSLATRIAGFINFAVIIALAVALYTTMRTHLLEERGTAQSLAELGASRGPIVWVYGIRLLALLFIAMFFAYLAVALIYRWQISHFGADISPLMQLSASAFNTNALKTCFEVAAIGIGMGAFAFWFNFQRSNIWLLATALIAFAGLGFYIFSSYQFNRESYAVLGIFALAIFGFWLFLRIFKLLIRKNAHPRSLFRLSLLEYAGKHSAQENFGTLIFANLVVIACFAAIFMSIRNLAWDFESAPKPSHYVADIQEDQLEQYVDTMGLIGATDVKISPIVLARFSKVNGEAPTMDHPIFNGDRYLGADQNNQYDLNITEDGLVEIAMDENLAQEMGLGLGDIFTINVLDKENELVIRALRQTTIDPNQIDFTILLPEEFVNDAPHIYVSSLHLTAQQTPVVKNIVDRFPNTIVVSSDRALNRFESWITQLLDALRLLGFHILSATLIALFCVGWLIMRKERYDQSILEIMGMRAKDRGRLQFNKVWINAVFASIAGFFIAIFFVKYGIEPVLGVELKLDYVNLALITLITGMLCSAVPAFLMMFKGSHSGRVEEYAQDYHRMMLDF